jgi:hypothetical protein
MHAFDYVYHQILRKEADWVARDLFRESYRQHAETVQSRMYDHQDVGCLLLSTSHEILLDDMLSRPIESDDVLSNANTIILMGKAREGSRMRRALHVAKHRGSQCDDAILMMPFCRLKSRNRDCPSGKSDWKCSIAERAIRRAAGVRCWYVH